MTIRDALNLMRGPSGTKLTLTILRKNIQKPLNFPLTREIIRVKSIKYRLLEKSYGYVRIALFQETTEKDLSQAISKLKKQSNGKLRGIILDLRNNSGGLLESATQVTNDLLDSDSLNYDKLIVYTKGQSEDSRLYIKATSDDITDHIPLVVLINDGSASASEIVAGALQDHKRAVIIGTRSFGKGSVQTLLPIDKHSAVKLTTALYYTPAGRSIQAKGIEPDIVVNELQVSKIKPSAFEALHIDESKLMDHLDNDSSENDENSDISNKQNLTEKKSTELMHSDYQLYEALNVLKCLNVLPRK
jgi:carboxyl-terminal processing protease